ncbi:MAG: Cro/Cl family transcriptional regulator [Magnetococcales bacterium]|nr:Cro/Cl family transcriptional regulator [Magnetococcales bacterium]
MNITEHIVSHFGGISELAKALGIRRQAIYQWERIPVLRAYQIERLTKGELSIEMMRPDLYGCADGTKEGESGMGGQGENSEEVKIFGEIPPGDLMPVE